MASQASGTVSIDASAPTGPGADAPSTPDSGVKRPRASSVTTFILPDNTRYDLPEDGATAFPDRLLHRLITSDLTVRDAEGCIAFNFPCDGSAFALALAEHEHRARYGHQETGPALTTPICPIELGRLWDYLQLDMDLIGACRNRPGTPLPVMVSQAVLYKSIAIAQQLLLFLKALRSSGTWQSITLSIALPPGSNSGSCRLALWLGNWPFADTEPEWRLCDSENKAYPTPPARCRAFPRQLFDVLKQVPRAAALAQRYLPEYAEELKHLSLTACTTDDRSDLLRYALEGRIAQAALRLGAKPPIVEGLLGGAALAIPIVPMLAGTFAPIETFGETHFDFGRFEVHLTVSVLNDEEGDEEMVTMPESFVPSARYGTRMQKKLAARRFLHISALAYLRKSDYRHEIDLPAIAITCHAQFPCAGRTTAASRLAMRNAYFGEKREPSRRRPPTVVASEEFSGTQYMDVLRASNNGQPLASGVEGFNYVPSTTHVQVCPDGMSVPSTLCCEMVYPAGGDALHGVDLQSAVAALDESDKLGSDNCLGYAFVRLEAHATGQMASPGLDKYDPDQTIENGSEAQFAWLDIAGI